ncbi:tandem-95 repeat protein, partial [Roseomonas sp. AR75]|uniref:tandem-95 repeat protein n=1 Tax=Roseomonas sp. AR75 TaxID=2562311 RepID=UPI0010C0F12C
APPADFNGTVSFDFVANDGTTDSNTGTVTIEVNAVNDAPVVQNGQEIVLEDGTLNGSLASLAFDVDGDTLTFVLADAPDFGDFTWNTDGTYIYSPSENFTLGDSFQFYVNDGTADSNVATLTIVITPVNDAPVVADDTIVIAEAGFILADLNDLLTDPDGGTPSFSLVGPNPAGVVVNPNGTWQYAPGPDFNGTISFQYRANDGTDDSNVATITIEVTPVNDAPTDIALSNASVQENSPNGTVVGLLSATDIDSSSFTYSILGGPTPFAIVGNQLQVAGALDYETQDAYTLTIQANDGAGGTRTEAFVISVSDVDETPDNQAPTVEDGVASVNEDGTLNGSVTSLANDPDGDNLVFALVGTTPAGLTFNGDGSYVYTPPANFNGSITFDFIANDGNADSNQGTVTVTVNAVNDAPTAPDGPEVAVNEDTYVFVTREQLIAGATDAEGDALFVTGLTTNAFVTGYLQNDGIWVSGTLNTNGTRTATYQLSDGNGGLVDGILTLNIAPVNDAPTVTATTFAGTEDQPFIIAITDLLAQVAADVDGDTISFLNVSGPFGGTVTTDAGNLIFTPQANRDSAGSFFLSVTDGTETAGGTITVTLAPVNDAPVAGDDVVARSGSPQVISFATLFANDSDVDTPAANRTISAIGNESGVTVAVDNVARTVTVTYDAGHVGGYSFEYTVSDGAGGFDTALVTLNNPPVATDDTTTIGENDSWTNYHFVNVTGNDSDADGDLLTVTGVTALGGAPIIAEAWDSNADGRNDSLRFYVNDPSNNTNGTFQVEYTVSDQRGGTDTAVVTINVTPEDDAPIVRPDLLNSEIVTTSQFTPVDIAFSTLLANDEHPDGTDFTITSVQFFSRGSAVLVDTDGDLVNDAVRFTPDANVGGVQDYASSWLAYFYYTVTETNGDGDTASTYAYVRVNDVNEDPSAEDDTVARSGDPQVIAFDTVFANDYDWDSPTSGWTITGISAESGVTVTVDGVARTLTVDYDAGHTGAYSFDYTMSDGEGGTATATVSLNTVPIADDDTVTVGENDAYFAVQYVDVLANDEDADGDALSIVNAQALGGVPVVAYWSAENFLTFYLTDPYFNDAFEIQYTVSDGRGATDTAILSVTVTPQNDAPVGVSEQIGTFSTAEDTAIVIPVASLLANGDFDGDSEDFWISSVTYYGPFGGTAVLDDKGTADHADDEVVFTPNANFNGNAYFYYSLTDAAGATDLDTYAYVTVTPVNDPVTANDDVIARLFPEAGTQTITRAQLVGNDVDVDSDAAITGVVAGANVSSIVLNADQSVTVTYTSGSATFTYTLSDGTFSDTAEVTLNSGPQQTGTPGVLNLTEDTQSYFTDDQLIALAGVTDANNDNLFISGYGTNPNVGVWGGWWWQVEENWLTPGPENFNGPATFTFTISDGNTATDLTVTLDVQVAPVDDLAVAEDDSDPAWVTNEQTGIVIQIADLLANDYDVEGDSFAATSFYTSYLLGSGSVVNNGNGTVTYTPGQNVAEGFNPVYGGNYWYGYDGPGFFYTVTGGDTAFVRVIVNNINDPVVAADDYVARPPGAPEEQDVTYAQMVNNDSNPDPNGTLTIISVQNAVNGTAVLNDNGTAGDASDDFVTFTHTGGSGSYEYTVQDEGGSTSTATVYFNGAPVAQPDAITVSETEATYSPDGGSRNIALTRLELVGNDSDPEGQTLFVTSPGIYPAWDESVIQSVSYYGSGVTIYLLDPDWEGETWFEYRAYDSGSPTAYSEPVRVTLTIEDGNDTPLASWDYWYYSGVGYNDTNPATNPLVGYEDSYLDIPVSLLIDGQYVNGVYQTGADFDEEGDALSIDPGSFSSSYGFAQLVDIDGEAFVRFTPNVEQSGEFYFYYAVTDGNTTSPTAGVYVYITAVNDAPVVDDAIIPVPIGDSEFFVSFSQLLSHVSDEDHNDFELSFLDAFAVSGGTISIEGNGIRFFADGSGDPMQFEYSFADPEGASDSGVITLDPTEAPPVVLYFRGYDYQGGGYQLWHYVPSESPFVEVALQDIDGYSSYYPYNITPYGDGVVFSASSYNDGLYTYSEVGGLQTLVSGDSIYEVLVVGDDLYATSYAGFYAFGPDAPNGYVEPSAYGISELTEGNGVVFFAGYNSDFGELAIFRYDPGTQSIEQFVISTDGSIDNISDMVVTEDAVFFVADSFGDAPSSYGTLFRLDLDDETVDGDGFAIGTVSSFGWTGMAEGEPYARDLVAVGEQVYFIAYNENYNEQLWRADDSGAGVVVYDNSSGQDGQFYTLDYDGQYSLIEFQDGVLAHFYDYDTGVEGLYFGNESGFVLVDDWNYDFQDLQVVDGEAFYIAQDGDGYGYEVFVFDGTSVQRLTDHDPYYMNELEVLSRERLFVTSSDYYGGEGGSSDAIYEYNPADYGDTATHRLERGNTEIAYYNLTASEYGLYFNHAVGNNWYTYFVSYNTFELQNLDGFSLSSNGERGFFGQVPLASFTYGQGAEAAFYEGTVVVDGLDIAPGQDPDFPANPANSFPSGFAQLEQLGDSYIADIYTVANIPALGEDTAYLFRISYDVDTQTRSFEQVHGLSAVGSPTDPNTLPEYILAPIALGDALLVNKYIPDYANNVYTYELWAVRGTTATLVDDQTGYVFRTEAAQVGDFLFFEDEFTGGFGSEVRIYDLATGTTTLVDLNPGAERGDPREFVAADGGVYLRAQLDANGFSGNNELVRIETDGSFTIIDLEDNAGGQVGSFPRQIATDGTTVYAFGDTEGGPALWLVSGTTVEMRIDLFNAGISGIPFLDAGTEFYDGGLFFFADSWSNGTQLFRFDLASQEVSQITAGTTSARYDAFDYSMEVAEGVLWFVYDEGYGDGLEVHAYDGVGYGSWTDLDLGGYGYQASDLAAIAAQDDIILVT